MANSEESPLLSYLVTNEPAFRKPRLAALYSDFSTLQNTNSEGYSANVEAWRKGLAHASIAGVLPSGSLLTLAIDTDLQRSLQSKQWGSPLALGTVVQEGIQRKDFVPLRDFLAAKESIYENPWSLNPLHLVGWGLRFLGVLGTGNKLSSGQGKLVLLGNVEEAGKAFALRTIAVKGRVESIWSRQMFMKEFGDLLGPKTPLVDGDFEILLRFLERDKSLISYNSSTIKLRRPGENNVITQEDTTVATLKTLISDLEAQTQILEKRVEQLSLAARQAVEKKNRISALAALRSKKLAEATLVKRHATLAQLEEVFIKIEQAADQVDLVRIMEASTSVLAGFNKQVGGVERVDDVLEGLREQMGQVDEVGNVLAEQGREGVDEGEVDDELEAMEKVEKEKRDAIERKECEERENKEAEETRKRLDALEEAETGARQKKEAAEAAAIKSPTSEKDLEDSMERLEKMSLEPPQKEIA